jgi:hypothetical protein
MASLTLARQSALGDARADQSFELLPLCAMHPTRPRSLGTPSPALRAEKVGMVARVLHTHHTTFHQPRLILG